MSELVFGYITIMASSVTGDALGRFLSKALQMHNLAGPTLPTELSLPTVIEEWHDQLGKELKRVLSRQCNASPVLAQALALDSALKQSIFGHIITSDPKLSPHLQEIEAKLTIAHFSADKDMEEANKIADSVKQTLEEVVANAQTMLQNAYLQAVSQTVRESLEELGYTVSEEEDNQAKGIWARKDYTAVAVVVNNQGEIKLDMMGFEGLACQKEKNNLLKKMEEKGLRFEQKSRIIHGRKEGGNLIEQALKLSRRTSPPLPMPRALLKVSAFKTPQDQRQRMVWGSVLSSMNLKEVY